MSNIISETIDAEYPVAGVDNDTQGFRDNFQIIKTGLQTAKNEITNLEERTVKLVDDNDNATTNDFRESAINNASLENITFKLRPDAGDITENQTVNVDVANGHYQVYTIGEIDTDPETIVFSIEGWPVRNTNDGVAKLTLHLKNSWESSRIIKFVAANGGAIYKTSDWPATGNGAVDALIDDSAPISIAAASENRPTIVEFWTYDAGVNVYANLLGVFRKSSDA